VYLPAGWMAGKGEFWHVSAGIQAQAGVVRWAPPAQAGGRFIRPLDPGAKRTWVDGCEPTQRKAGRMHPRSITYFSCWAGWVAFPRQWMHMLQLVSPSWCRLAGIGGQSGISGGINRKTPSIHWGHTPPCGRVKARLHMEKKWSSNYQDSRSTL
jgi:hypothetical protein